MEPINWDEFTKVELRVGKIISAKPFPEARKPAYILEVDFGEELGIKKSSAQLTALYKPEELVGRLVVAVVNFPKKQIGPFMSECLVTGFHNENGEVALCVPDKPVPLGSEVLGKWTRGREYGARCCYPNPYSSRRNAFGRVPQSYGNQPEGFG